MPGRRRLDLAVDDSLCRRCQVNQPAITVRTEPLCVECFGKYVFTKVVKRMESFRVRHAQPGEDRVLLLPLSLGPSSMMLLHILSQHLRGQAEKTGRTGFRLHVLHIDGSDEVSAHSLQKVRERYPEHLYTSCPLSDVLSLDGVQELLGTSSGEDSTTTTSIYEILNRLDSATSRDDVMQILLRKLILSYAKQQGYKAVLWGDSTTKLAERTLAETAKGRGFNMSYIVSDGESPQGVPFYYPMRDLLRKEIIAFASLMEPNLDELIVKDEPRAAVSTKNTTIDELMKQYFESVEQEYPSIVANVVKTIGKLRATSLQDIEQQCELCDAPLDGQAPERSRLCYGCIRTLPQTPG